MAIACLATTALALALCGGGEVAAGMPNAAPTAAVQRHSATEGTSRRPEPAALPTPVPVLLPPCAREVAAALRYAGPHAVDPRLAELWMLTADACGLLQEVRRP